MDDDYIRRGLHKDDIVDLPEPRDDRSVHFCHYYHPHRKDLEGKPLIQLIGFPLDSFYSDGVVAFHGGNDPRPSGPRAAAFVMRLGSPEWCALESRMRENAEWLATLVEDDRSLILRYEDLVAGFDNCANRLEAFVGGFLNPIPRPKKNPLRSYWTENYAETFDRDALNAIWNQFEPSIRRFYPERADSLEAAL
jgi:hypothetical protein